MTWPVFRWILSPPVHRLAQADPEERRRSGMLVGSLNIALLVCLLHMPVLLAIGANWLAATTAISSVLILAIMVGNHLWHAHGIFSHLLVLTAGGVILSGPVFAHGSFIASLPWMIVLPVLAVMLIGRWAGLSWMLVVLLVNLLAWSVLDLSHEPELSSTLLLTSNLGLPVTVLGLTWTWEQNRVRAWRMQLDLERRLREINRELARAQAMSRLVLDNVGHAMILLTPTGTVARERSAAARRLVGELPVGRPVWEAFAQDAPTFAQWVESSFLSAEGGWVPLEHSLAQIPKEARRAGRQLEVEFRVVDREDPDSAVLLVATDVTDLRRAQAAEQTTREAAMLLVQAMEDQHLVRGFMREGDRLVGGITTKGWPVADQMRAIHTLKGSSAVMGLAQFATWLHELENRLDGDPPGCSIEDAVALTEHWQTLRQLLLPVYGRVEYDDLVVHRFELDELIALAQRSGPSSRLLPGLVRLGLEPVAPRLALLARQAEDIGRQAGKGPIRTRVQCGAERVPPSQAWFDLWTTLVHVVRNAVDHAFERPEERVALGKPPSGLLELRAHSRNGRLVIEIEDDGRGIDWAQVERRARAMGLPCASAEELEASVFAEGLSTTREVTQLSGRGVGLNALHHAVRRLGARVEACSGESGGTIIRIEIPMGDDPGIPRQSVPPLVAVGELEC